MKRPYWYAWMKRLVKRDGEAIKDGFVFRNLTFIANGK
jgi:hypothetical protein